jgi:Tol biopolymer transport system component
MKGIRPLLIRVLSGAVVVTLGVCLHPGAAYAATNITTRVNLSTAGVQATSGTLDSSVSADGRYVVFEATAGNLVLDDTNGVADIFVRDRLLNITTRVSVNDLGWQANNASTSPRISGDGRYVAFISLANNLVGTDTNSTADVFVRDRLLGTTRRVSVATGGTQSNGSSGSPAISADGRYVAFTSWANNLVSGDTNTRTDIFVHDRVLGATSRVSVNGAGAQGDADSDVPSLSGDGRYVAYASAATNLVSADTNGAIDIFVRDRTLGTTVRTSPAAPICLSAPFGPLPVSSTGGSMATNASTTRSRTSLPRVLVTVTPE